MLEPITVTYETLKDELRSVFKQIPHINSRRVFIKPNLGGRYPIIDGENNDIKFLSSLCEALIESNASENIIAHSSLIGFGYSKYCKFEDIIKINHYDQLQKLSKVCLLNLDDVERQRKSVNGFTFNIPKILEADNIFFINLSKMKTHMETTVSLSLKNLMGLVSLENRKSMHMKDLNTQIAHLSKIMQPDLNIIDGIIGMEGNGPHHGETKKANLVVIADNCVEGDSLACYLMGIDYKKVRHIAESKNIGVGNFINGETENAHTNKVNGFKMADQVYKKGTKFYVWPTTSCSACIFSLSKAFDELIRKHPLRMLKKLFIDETNIFIGECYNINGKNRKNVYAIGSCCEDIVKRDKIDKYLKGCPPKIEEIIKFLGD